MSPRTGRPKVDSPKEIIIRCRITKELHDKLKNYCADTGLTISKVIEKGILSIINEK